MRSWQRGKWKCVVLGKGNTLRKDTGADLARLGKPSRPESGGSTKVSSDCAGGGEGGRKSGVWDD